MAVERRSRPRTPDTADDCYRVTITGETAEVEHYDDGKTCCCRATMHVGATVAEQIAALTQANFDMERKHGRRR
jgi:hypothetical protein